MKTRERKKNEKKKEREAVVYLAKKPVSNINFNGNLSFLTIVLK